MAGGASDIRGEVNAASVYSYCDQSFDAWEQRPRFISHVAQLTELRLCEPHVEPHLLRLITKYFSTPTSEFDLDSSYEPDKTNLAVISEANKEHEKIFGHLQKYRAARLLVPIGTEHMYNAAVENKSCKLTPLGKLYWQLVDGGKI